MTLYHGSPAAGITLLEPRTADHGKPYIYLSVSRTAAGLYLANAVEKPYYWFPYGFDGRGRVEYHELYPHALDEVYSGQSGYIYTVSAKESGLLTLNGIPHARLSEKPLPVSGCEEIPDCRVWLAEREKAGEFVLRRYEDKTPEQLSGWYKMLLGYIREKNMISSPECSYARFIREKFPFIWEEYVHSEIEEKI